MLETLHWVQDASGNTAVVNSQENKSFEGIVTVRADVSHLDDSSCGAARSAGSELARRYYLGNLVRRTTATGHAGDPWPEPGSRPQDPCSLALVRLLELAVHFC